MTYNERICIYDALCDSGLGDLAGFKTEVYHNMGWPQEDIPEYWEIMLIPMLDRIFLIEQIFEVITSLNVSVAIYTTINHPGCLIIH